MEKKVRYLVITALVVLVFVSGGLGGIAIDRILLVRASPTGVSFIPENASSDFQLIARAWNEIKKSYVDQPSADSKTLTYGAISGMVDALGDTGHSRFLSPDMVRQEQNATQGQFEGVGLEVNSKNGQTVIVAPIDGSPAQKAGLTAGEIILKVDGTDVSSLPLSQVVSKILGPAGTPVTLTIFDPTSGDTKDYNLTRARISIENVTWSMIPGTNLADIRIAAFSQGVDKNLISALKQIQAQKAGGIILDLRNNPGGLLDQAVAVASQFKGSGLVLEERDASGAITQIPVKSGGLATDIPVVVLINGGSASASEIVTAALQDGHRATVVGETTIGTGTVLNQFNLPDGSALLLATQEWLTPGGQSFWHKGIEPDVKVTQPGTALPVPPAQLKSMTDSQLKSSQDQQLLKGVELLSQVKASGK